MQGLTESCSTRTDSAVGAPESGALGYNWRTLPVPTLFAFAMSRPVAKMTGLNVNVADLLHHPGARRVLRRDVAIEGLATRSATVRAPVALDIVLERVEAGILAMGEVRGRWSSVCSRCLTPLQRDFHTGIRELYEPTPVEAETYPLVDETIDLEFAVRDSVILDLPLAPLCRPSCKGLCPTCGVDSNKTACECEIEQGDPRWAALADLQLVREQYPEESN